MRRLPNSLTVTSMLRRSLFGATKTRSIIRGESKPRKIRSSLLNVMSMTFDSGSLNAECEAGSTICTSSGGRNCVVSMKNVSRRNATSTIGVMSILTETLAFFILGIGVILSGLLCPGGQCLHHVVAGFVDHIGEIVHLVDEKVVRNDSH